METVMIKPSCAERSEWKPDTANYVKALEDLLHEYDSTDIAPLVQTVMCLRLQRDALTMRLLKHEKGG